MAGKTAQKGLYASLEGNEEGSWDAFLPSEIRNY